MYYSPGQEEVPLPNKRNHEKKVVGIFDCQLGGDVLPVHWQIIHTEPLDILVEKTNIR